MEGPTGDMDQKRPQLEGLADDKNSPGASTPGHEFLVCDLGDEEVHFSRHASDFYYRQNDSRGPSSGSNRSQLGFPASSSPYTKMARKSSSASFHSLDANHFASPDNSYQHNQYHQQFAGSPEAASGEQAASSRLLNSLGNKLRRGSNYLNAPTKLLGQYLLGITIKSWSEFFNTSRMMRAPTTRSQLSRRLATNLSHFQGNYLCVSLVLVIYCVLTSPLLLIAIAAYLLALYLVTARTALGKQTRVFGYRLNLQQQYSFITMLSLPPLWIAGAPSALFWVIGASFFVVGLHASMYANEQLAAERSLVVASRARHSLTVHTPTYHIGSPSQQQGGSGGGFLPLGHHQQAAATPVGQYYNHYPGVSRSSRLAYTPIAAQPSSPTGIKGPQTSGGYVSSAISNWIPFGGGFSSSPAVAVQVAEGPPREPEVKIISQDYAGLGRVYEV